MDVRCSDGQVRQVDDQLVEELVALAEELGRGEDFLDDLVVDCCEASASSRVNNDPGLGDDIFDVQEAAYEEADTLASNVNNSGLHGQIAFLVAEVGEAGVRDELT